MAARLVMEHTLLGHTQSCVHVVLTSLDIVHAWLWFSTGEQRVREREGVLHQLLVYILHTWLVGANAFPGFLWVSGYSDSQFYCSPQTSPSKWRKLLFFILETGACS